MSRAPRRPFKRPPKRHQPKGLNILFEDHDMIVVDKVGGLLAVSTEKVRESTAYFLLTNYVRKGNAKSRNRIFVVHRLDRETSGILVFAKTPDAKRFLQDHWADFQKTYLAVVAGRPEKDADLISSHLAENKAHQVYVCDDPKRGKLARTGYRVLESVGGHSLLEIDLMTGRKHQIRVHMADLGCPIVGDRKYGTGRSGSRQLALHAAKLTVRHPYTDEEMCFETPPPRLFAQLMRKS